MGRKGGKRRTTFSQKMRNYKHSKAMKQINGPFLCPKCGKLSLVIKKGKITNGKIEVQAICGCGVNGKVLLKYSPVFTNVDYYNQYIDLISKGMVR
jgi:transcription elongation factor Elf1